MRWAVVAGVLLVVVGLVWWFGPGAGVAGLVATVGGWFTGRRRPSADDAQARLDDAVELGKTNIERANELADEEVDRGMDDTLAGYLNDRTRNG